MNKVAAKIKRIWLQFRLMTIRDGWKKAEYLKKHNIFNSIGEHCYYASVLLPAEPELVTLHDNVVISAGVRLITHSVAHVVFNREESANKYVCRFGRIEIGNNVYVGADSIIQFDVNVGDNCIIAAGGVVTRNIETNSVVAGVPARKICSYEDAKRKHLLYSKKFGDGVGGDTWVSELIKISSVESGD